MTRTPTRPSNVFHSPVIVDAGLGQADSHPGLTLQTVVLQPLSRGTLTLRDADPLSHPVIDPNYLADPEDMRRMIGGLRYVREVLKAPALADILCSKLESNPDFSTDKASPTMPAAPWRRCGTRPARVGWAWMTVPSWIPR